jgi:hypothetical protein
MCLNHRTDLVKEIVESANRISLSLAGAFPDIRDVNSR